MIKPCRFALASFLMLAISSVVAQDLTHPTRMGLPGNEFERPSPTDFQLTLDNGLTAFVAEAHQAPLVTLSAFIRVGLVDDDQQGSAETLLGALRSSGPDGMTSDAFRATLRRMTADYTVEMHAEWTEISLNVPVEDLGAALPL
ncbi:MAG: M16 family metallopeptidase, partial [Woeseiaceae bacterium]